VGPHLEHQPILFDEALIELADEAIREVAPESHRLPSGPLHDAAEVARAGVPTVMVFVQSLRGLSHTRLEDTKPEHLELSVQALDRLAAKTPPAVAILERTRIGAGSRRAQPGSSPSPPEEGVWPCGCRRSTRACRLPAIRVSR
jgi:hypothetical protein